MIINPETVILCIRELQMFTTMVIPSDKHEIEIYWNPNYSTSWITKLQDDSEEKGIRTKRFKFIRSEKLLDVLGRKYPVFGFAGLLPCECKKCEDGDTCATDTNR